MSSTLDNKLVQRQTQAGHLTKFVKMFHCSDLVFETLVKSGQHCNIPKHRTPSYSQFLFLFFFLLQVSLHAFPGQLLLSLVSFRVAPKPLPVSPAFLPALVLLHPPATQHCNQSKASLSVSARRRPITQSNKVAFMTI